MQKEKLTWSFPFCSKSSKFNEGRLKDQILFLSMKINDKTSTCYTENGRFPMFQRALPRINFSRDIPPDPYFLT